MSIQIAWPICNRPAGDYAIVANSVCLGRPFRQPLNLPDANNFVDGLELWLRDDDAVMSLHACFNGFLSFYPTESNQPASLKLSPNPNTSKELRRLNIVEPGVQSLIYANVDRTAVREALINLITAAHTAATGRQETWHTVMRFRRNNVLLKIAIDRTGVDQRPAFIEQVVDHVLNNSATNSNARLPVAHSDIIGKAATAFGNAAPPANCNLGAAPRYLIFKIEERGGQIRNPLSDLWSWVNRSSGANPLINLQAPHQIGTANPHPLAQVTNLSLNTPKPPARVETAAPLRPVPMLELVNYHHHDNARVEWHLTDEGILEAQLRANQPGAAPNFTPANHTNLIERMWTEYGTDITDMSNAFQVPIELIMAFLGKETGNLNERAARFEPVDNAERQATRGEPLNNPTYQGLAARYMQVIPAGGHSLNVPDPWNANGFIRQTNGTELTWGQMSDLLDLSPYFRTRLSPGLMQTLIETATRTLNWVRVIFNDIQNTLPHDPAPANWWTYFNVVQPPANASGYLNNWLLVPRHSILAGTAYIRSTYNNVEKKETFWDPPKTAAAYNAGNVRDPIFENDDTPAERLMKRTWGLHYYADYMTRYGSVYNAAVDHINTHPDLDPAPSVRLRR